MMPNTISVVPTMYRLRAAVSIWSRKMNPKMTIGMVPITRYQPMRALRSLRSEGVVHERTHVVAMRSRSRQKYRTTASIVPSWMMAVKRAPGSFHPKKAGASSRWPELEMGRNSVSPWMIP